MSDAPREAAVSRGKRVYEYTDQDGNVFWSFQKFPSVVTPSRIMTIGDRVGTHLENHLSELRILRRYLIEQEKEKSLGRG